jgi:hypothetical protein
MARRICTGLLDIFSVVARKRQGAVLVMVGDGPDKVD